MPDWTPVKLQADPSAADKPLDELGWVGQPRDAKVAALAAHLQASNGIKGIEVCTPDEVERATRLFYRDGFVAVRNALTAAQLALLRKGCDSEIRAMLSHDSERAGNRGSHRYSFGSASLTGQLLHHPEWAMLVDLPAVTPILTAIFGSPDYICHGGAGDFCLPGAVEYQPLHSDMSDRRVHNPGTAKEFATGAFHDPRGRLNYRDLPCPFVVCNYLMVDFTPLRGPTRQIPGTQHSQAPIPALADEPEWMKLSTVCPAPAGSVLIRDVRAWHGGTPNLSDQVRAIPNAEYYAPWFRQPMNRCMPREIYATLSPHGQRLCREIVAERGEVLQTGYRRNLGALASIF